MLERKFSVFQPIPLEKSVWADLNGPVFEELRQALGRLTTLRNTRYASLSHQLINYPIQNEPLDAQSERTTPVQMVSLFDVHAGIFIDKCYDVVHGLARVACSTNKPYRGLGAKQLTAKRKAGVERSAELLKDVIQNTIDAIENPLLLDSDDYKQRLAALQKSVEDNLSAFQQEGRDQTKAAERLRDAVDGVALAGVLLWVVGLIMACCTQPALWIAGLALFGTGVTSWIVGMIIEPLDDLFASRGRRRSDGDLLRRQASDINTLFNSQHRKFIVDGEMPEKPLLTICSAPGVR